MLIALKTIQGCFTQMITAICPVEMHKQHPLKFGEADETARFEMGRYYNCKATPINHLNGTPQEGFCQTGYPPDVYVQLNDGTNRQMTYDLPLMSADSFYAREFANPERRWNIRLFDVSKNPIGTTPIAAQSLNTPGESQASNTSSSLINIPSIPGFGNPQENVAENSLPNLTPFYTKPQWPAVNNYTPYPYYWPRPV
jgi:hypothetical protein